MDVSALVSAAICEDTRSHLVLIEDGGFELPRRRLDERLDLYLQLLTPALYRRHRLAQRHLEARELLVDVVLGLVLETAGVGLGVVEDLASPPLGLADHLGTLHEPSRLHICSTVHGGGATHRLRNVVV